MLDTTKLAKQKVCVTASHFALLSLTLWPNVRSQNKYFFVHIKQFFLTSRNVTKRLPHTLLSVPLEDNVLFINFLLYISFKNLFNKLKLRKLYTITVIFNILPINITLLIYIFTLINTKKFLKLYKLVFDKFDYWMN